VNFELLSDDEDVTSSRVSVNGDTGSFEIQDVMPGVYTLRATQESLRAEARVTVNGGDLRGVAATMVQAVDIPVRIQVTNPPAAEVRETPAGRTVPFVAMRTNLSAGFWCRATLISAGRRASEARTAQIPRKNGEQLNDSEWVLSNVYPGAYRISFQCSGGYPRSATFNTQDLLANPLVTIGPGASGPIEILGTLGGGTVEATLATDSGADKSKIGAILVPQFSPSTGPLVSQRGRLQWYNLAPGSYAAYVFSNMDNVEYRDPVFLRSLAGGMAVQVEDKGKATIEIQKVNP